MKRITLFVILVALVLLTACGKQTDRTANNHGAHEEHGQEASPEASISTQADWKLSTDSPKSNEETSITIQIQTEDGKAIEEFDINHEKKLHLIVVSKDLSYFNHIHPEYKGNGKFEIATSFPSGGDFKLIADYIPTGGTATTQFEWVKVGGPAVDPTPVTPSKERSVVVDGVEVTLESDHPEAGKDFILNFKLADAQSKEPITDLQPYLGAVGHVVIVSNDVEQYLHVHPMEEKATGPDAKFMTKFPNSGIYKIWGQFQRNGKTFISPFVVEVK